MGIYNNDSLKEAPKKKTSNTVTPDAPSGRISKSKSSEPVKKTSNTLTPDAPSKNAPREKSIPLPIRMKNIVTPDAPSPAASKTSAPVVTKTAAPTVTKTAAPVAKSRYERMRDVYASYGKESDTAENQAIQKRLSGGMANYKSGGSVKASRGDGIAQRGKTRGRIC